MDAMTRRARFFVYGLIDPRTGLVRYVGCTADLARRLSCHVTKPQPSLRDWLSGLRSVGLAPSMIVLAFADTREEGLTIEAQEIARRCEAGEPLLNLYRNRRALRAGGPRDLAGAEVGSERPELFASTPHGWRAECVQPSRRDKSRDDRALAMHRDGMKLREIAAALGMSLARAGQIVRRARMQLETSSK